MREIKFRARRIDNGQWVYGQYFKTPLTDENSGATPDAGWFFLSGEPRHCIVQNVVSFVIDLKTLGQYTGLQDRNGVEIYEGDIAIHAEDESEDGPAFEEIGVVEWENEPPGYIHVCKSGSLTTKWLLSTSHMEIIGNIYESPHLLDKAI